MNKSARFLEGSLLRHIAIMSVTASVGLMAVFVVDFVDVIFISMLGKTELAAAVGYAGAILYFTSSFGLGIAAAVGALVARAIGASDTRTVRRLTSNALVYALIFAAVFAAITWMNLHHLTRLVGASGQVQTLSVSYLAIIVPSLPLQMLAMVGGGLLRAHGDARRAMMATIWGGLVNAVLDPILIFGLDLELTGAALASVAARATMVFAMFWPIYRFHGGLQQPDPKELAVDLRPILAIAVPVVATQMANPVGQAYVIRSMAQFGESAVAGTAILARMTPVAFAVILALPGALGPIIGQNFGAGRYDRVRGAYRDGLIFIVLMVVLVSGTLFALRGLVADLFDADGMALTLIYLFCGPLALAFAFNGVIFASAAVFNNLGHASYSTWVNWGRQTLGTILPVIVFSAWLGAPGVLIGQAVGGVIFAGIAVSLASRVLAHLPDEPHKPERGFARQSRQMALFHLRR